MSTAKRLAPVAAPAHAITNQIGYAQKDREKLGLFCCHDVERDAIPPYAEKVVYLPRKYEITAPKKPNSPRLRINNPVGMFAAEGLGASVNDG
jgi:hypothetical protein